MTTQNAVSASVRVSGRPLGSAYPWLVFALAFGLLLSDYMSRQVLSAVFPVLKSEWALSDSHLASLSSIVALMVGLLTLPISIVADRWGRVRSLVMMAVLWSVATGLCAVAMSYHQMLAARFLVGVGEAAYGSVGIAVVLSIFARRLHATLSGAFMAGGSFGSVVGVVLGGYIAAHTSWRWSFVVMAVFGLVLVVAFRAVVNERRLAEHGAAVAAEDTAASSSASGFRAPLSSLYTNPAVLCAYVGGGLQMFTAGVLLSWMPSYFNRYHGLGTDKAAAFAAVLVLLVGSGMVVCGLVTDRVGRRDVRLKWVASIVFCLFSLVCLPIGFHLGSGPLSTTLIGIGAFFAAGSSGPIAAMVANLTHASVRASAMGTLTLANSLLGLALGPFVVGVLADRIGLLAALQVAPLAYIAAVVALVLGWRLHPASARKLARLSAPADG